MKTAKGNCSNCTLLELKLMNIRFPINRKGFELHLTGIETLFFSFLVSLGCPFELHLTGIETSYRIQ